jgi:hypothetical protein
MAVSSPVDHFSWYQKIPVLAHAPDYIVHAALVAIVIACASWIANRQIRKSKDNVIPDEKLTLKKMSQNIVCFTPSRSKSG